MLHRQENDRASAAAVPYNFGKLVVWASTRTGKGLAFVEEVLLSGKPPQLFKREPKRIDFTKSLMAHSLPLAMLAALRFLSGYRAVQTLLPLAIALPEQQQSGASVCSSVPPLLQRCLWQLARQIVRDCQNVTDLTLEVKKRCEGRMAHDTLGALVFCIAVLWVLVRINRADALNPMPEQPIADLWITLQNLKQARDVVPLLDRAASLGYMAELEEHIALLSPHWPGLPHVMEAAKLSYGGGRVLNLLVGVLQRAPQCPCSETMAKWLVMRREMATNAELRDAVVRSSQVLFPSCFTGLSSFMY